MSEFRPCPFCGGKVFLSYDVLSEINGIVCPRCHSLTKFYRIEPKSQKETFGETRTRWADAWNLRVHFGFKPQGKEDADDDL